jgi:hypothetical protein
MPTFGATEDVADELFVNGAEIEGLRGDDAHSIVGVTAGAADPAARQLSITFRPSSSPTSKPDVTGQGAKATQANSRRDGACVGV